MISWKTLYHILSNVIPLYVILIIAYSSVKWWKIFSPNECLGINRFVMLFAAPLFSIKYISNNNPYAMNYHFIAADTLQKGAVVVILFLWCKLSCRGSIEWFITLFSLSTLTNSLVMGIPLLGGMYGDMPSQSLMVQVSVLQSLIWYPSLLFLFEYRRATLLVPWKCPELPEVVAETCDSSSRNGDNLGFHDDDDDEERHIGAVDAVPPCHSREIIDGHDYDHDHDHHAGNDSYKGSTPWSDFGSRSSVEVQPETAIQNEPKLKDMFPSSISTKLIFIMVWMKLIRNPNFFSSIIALVWSLISFRWHIEMPTIVANTIKIMSDAGLGMAMFSLGLFMASQPRIIAGGAASASLAVAMRFIVGPTIMVATSLVVGLRGTVLQITILQAALPQAIVPFIFAREYNVHPAILSTSVGFGMLISLPITLVYYILLGLIIK